MAEFRMSFVQSCELSWLQKLAIRIVQHGAVPRHLAIVMDGSRRFARLSGIAVIDGQRRGFGKMTEAIAWCQQVGIEELTVYAFSIENFKRAKAEVDDLLALLEDGVREKICDADQLRAKRHRVRCRFVGNLAYLPVSLQQACAELSLATEMHSDLKVNVALSYTGREEMCTAVGNVLAGADEGVVKPCHFSEALLSSAMYFGGSPDPELLIRTSGEVRLSDFLLWQTGFSVVEIIKPLWPAFSIWNFLASIIAYQWQARRIAHASKHRKPEQNEASIGEAIAELGQFIETRRHRQLKSASEGQTVQRPLTETRQNQASLVDAINA